MASAPSVDELDLGLMAEGIVTLDSNGRLILHITTDDGSYKILDIQEALGKYLGQSVRFIMTPLSSVEILNQLVSSGSLDLDKVPRLKPKY